MKNCSRLAIQKEFRMYSYSAIVVSQSVHQHTHLKYLLSKNIFYKKYFYCFSMFCYGILILTSCTISKQISRQSNIILLKDSVVNTGHIGISIYEPATNKYWYNYEASKNFLPASNVKLFTLYAGLKYLGDSLTGLSYIKKNDTYHIYPTGDPTFLHPDFKEQIVYNFLKKKSKFIYHSQNYQSALGKGWAWDDYNDYYMVQRSEFPVYGNLIQLNIDGNNIRTLPENIHFTISDSIQQNNNLLTRNWNSNNLYINRSILLSKQKNYQIPLFIDMPEIINFLSDTLKQKLNYVNFQSEKDIKKSDSSFINIYSQPTDSLFKPMLYNSDNFFAEQTLLMVSNTHLGYMNESDLIDTLLSTDLKDMPQKPRWVDGSGLSRYNLFSPQSMVYILNKMQKEFGIKRLKSILPTGGEGTLKNYYQKDSGYIFAKTGSMSNHTAISGYLYSKKGRLLIFSLIANQFQGSTTQVRHAMERFLEGIRTTY